jgi:hypothetical protein
LFLRFRRRCRTGLAVSGPTAHGTADLSHDPSSLGKPCGVPFIAICIRATRRRAMLLRKHSLFFVPTYAPCTARPFRFSSSPLPRTVLTPYKHPLRASARRSYATHHASSSNASGTGIPIGQIHLGSAKAGSAKGIAIRDDITKSWKELTFPQKVVRTGAQTTNFAVIVIGVGVLVSMPVRAFDNIAIGSRDLLPCRCCILADIRDSNFQQSF